MRSSPRITVLDGGMGRELMRIGAPFRQPEWSALALLEGPDWVVQAHTNFIDAGAEVITTNSYAIVPFHLGDERFAARGLELAELSGRLARQAADAAPSPVRVAGSLPPLFGSYRPDLFDAAAAGPIIDPLVEGLAPHVDVWLGETLSAIAEVRTVRDAIDRAGVGDRPLWISFTLDDHHPGTLRSGEPIDEAVAAEVKAQGPGFEVDRELANQAWEEQKVLMYSLQSIPIAFAVFLFVMAALVFKFPIGVTLGSLITYIVMMIVDGYFDPSQIYKGIILKLILISVLWKAYKSARTAIEAG